MFGFFIRPHKKVILHLLQLQDLRQRPGMAEGIWIRRNSCLAAEQLME